VKDSDQYGRTEVWQLAEQTFRKRRGDCEDLSILLGDWLEANGFATRIALGQFRRSGHAWVVLHHDGHDYILEATGSDRRYRRMPPRAKLLTTYFPRVQFDSQEILFRTSKKWTGDYQDDKEWSVGPF
jgi:predicted transglutaminase-like cysteine proteinase